MPFSKHIGIFRNFLGNRRVENYTELVSNLLTAYKNTACNIPLKVHFLYLHLNVFPQNFGTVISDEYAERSHQMFNVEKQCQGKWSSNMLAD